MLSSPANRPTLNFLHSHVVYGRRVHSGGLVVPLLILLNYTNRSSVCFIPYSELWWFLLFQFWRIFTWHRARTHTHTHTRSEVRWTKNDDSPRFVCIMHAFFRVHFANDLMIYNRLTVSSEHSLVTWESNRECLRLTERWRPLQNANVTRNEN